MAKGKVLQTIIDISGEISPTLGKSITEVADRLNSVNVNALAVGASIAAIGGAAVVGFGKAAEYLKDLGTEYDKATNQMAASTGLVGDELANMEQQMKDVYGNNFGEDMQDVSDSMSEVYRQTKLTGDALQNTTEGAFALRDTFGYDIPETARAAKAMMENFGVSGEQAMSMIAAGAQNGLDYSGELIDSISEYSVHFEQLGFSADDMFHIFQQGAESGAWSLNVVGDAIKEFSILSIDGSENTITAFKELGLNAEEMMATFAGGGADAEAAFQAVIGRLTAIDDAVKQDEIGVSLFGSKWEDMSVDAIAALADIDSGAYDTGKALEGISNIKYNDLDSAIEGIKRQFETSMIPAAEKVTQALIDIAPKVEEMVAKAGPYLADLAEKIGPAIEKTIELGEQGFVFVKQKVEEVAPVVKDFVDNGLVWLKDNAEWLIPVVSGLAGAFAVYKAVTMAVTIWEAIKNSALIVSITTMGIATAATTALGAATAFLTSPLFLVAAAIGAVIAIGVALYRNWDTVKAKAVQLGAYLAQVWQNIKAKVSEVWSSIVMTLSAVWSNIKASASNFFQSIATGLSSAWSGLKGTAQRLWNGILKAINNVIEKIVTKVKNFVKNVKTKLDQGWSKLTSILTEPFEKLQEWIDKIQEKLQPLIDAVKSVGDAFSGGDSGGGEIPMAAAGGFTRGITIAGEAGTEAIISFDPAYRSQNLAYWAQAGQMLGADISDYNLGGTTGSGDYYDLGGVTFAPNVIVQGNADKQTIMEAIEEEYPEFLDMLEELIERRRKPAYA